jgi:hypothetical protein
MIAFRTVDGERPHAISSETTALVDVQPLAGGEEAVPDVG